MTQSHILYIQIASYWMKLIINNEKLLNFIKEEYRFEEVLPPGTCIGTLNVFTLGNKLAYVLCSGSGRKKFTLQVEIYTSIRFKEFLLQGLIEICVFDKNVFFIHGSCFYNKNSIYMFIGPPGRGKTTIIKLLRAKEVLSNDTTICQFIQGKLYIYPSPFDKQLGAQMLTQRKTGEIHIYELLQSHLNKLYSMDLQKKLKVLQLNFNFFMFIEQVDVSSYKVFKSYNRRAHKHMLALIRHTLINTFAFSRALTSKIFYLLK